jgi:hypothetical protein
MDVLNHNFIRLGLTRAKALQTVIRFPRETHRRFASPKSNALTLSIDANGVQIHFISRGFPVTREQRVLRDTILWGLF